MDTITPQTVLRVRQEGVNVLLVINGRAVEMPWHIALELGRALLNKGHLAEEIAKHEQVIYDQALLTRAGLPIGLAVNKDVASEAIKEASWGTKLRRYLPGGVRAKEFVGAPRVVNLPKKENIDADK